MNKKELIQMLESVDDDSEVILVVYTDEGYEAGYFERVDANVKYDSVTGVKLEEEDTVVELTTTTNRS